MKLTKTKVTPTTKFICGAHSCEASCFLFLFQYLVIISCFGLKTLTSCVFSDHFAPCPRCPPSCVTAWLVSTCCLSVFLPQCFQSLCVSVSVSGVSAVSLWAACGDYLLLRGVLPQTQCFYKPLLGHWTDFLCTQPLSSITTVESTCFECQSFMQTSKIESAVFTSQCASTWV